MARDAGRRDLRITVQAKGEPEIDSSGFPVDTWTDLEPAYAHKRTLTTAETWRAGRESAASMVAFIVAYRADLDPDVIDLPATRRVVDRGRVYDVVGAEAEGRKDLVRLLCLSGDDAEATAARAEAARR